MSIVTKTGDQGSTGLMYNRRVPKSDPRVDAYGSVDELNAALGWARALSPAGPVGPGLLAIQKQLVILMGELATDPADRERYFRDGFRKVEPAMIEPLETWIRDIEARSVRFDGWATPGATLGAASLDVARTTCRRAERRVHALLLSDPHPNMEILVYLNRLSDLLWLLARWLETEASARAEGTPASGNP
jgi:cob(I)alamin adenosyltransferase